jgi:diguanylate cyclase (GGDEF)-like protein
VVILPDGPGTDITAERIRAGIAALDIPHAASPAGIVTVSIGSAKVIPALTGSAQELVEQADTALYAAKRNGRNQVQAFQQVDEAGAKLDASTSP